MAGQGIERREVLRMLAVAAGAARFPGFARWSFACGHVAPDAASPRPAAYSPQFFAPGEYQTIETLADLILPNDGTPGARNAGVAEFIDFIVANDAKIQYRFRFGLAWLDAHSRRLSGKSFGDLARNDQAAILEPLAYKAKHRAGEEDGRAFFELMREYTVMGFYTSRVGLEQLDYPGLKLYSESPGCPHPEDPEHRHLSA